MCEMEIEMMMKQRDVLIAKDALRARDEMLPSLSPTQLDFCCRVARKNRLLK